VRRPDRFTVSRRVPRRGTATACAGSKSSLKGGHEDQRWMLAWAGLCAPSGRATAVRWSRRAKASRNSHCAPTATGMLRAQTSRETQSLKEMIWKARKRLLRPDVALPHVPVKRRRSTCAVRSTVRADAPAARRRVPARAGIRPANRSEPENPDNHPASCRSELGGV
jgi:hypothetical protein